MENGWTELSEKHVALIEKHEKLVKEVKKSLELLEQPWCYYTSAIDALKTALEEEK